MSERVAGQSADEKVRQLQEAQERWERGRDGERQVAAELDLLDRSLWFVLHDVRIGSRGANLDHLVIGPPGVFVINTKNVTGHVWVAERVLMVSGKRTDFLPKSTREAREVSQRLCIAGARDLDVTPVLVFVKSRPTIKAMPHDVHVVFVDDVRAWLEAKPTELESDRLQELRVRADAPSTWSSTSAAGRM